MALAAETSPGIAKSTASHGMWSEWKTWKRGKLRLDFNATWKATQLWRGTRIAAWKVSIP